MKNEIAQHIIELFRDEMTIQFADIQAAFSCIPMQETYGMDYPFAASKETLYYDPNLLCLSFSKNPQQSRMEYLHSILHYICFHVQGAEYSKHPHYDEFCDNQVLQLLTTLFPGQDVHVMDSHKYWRKSENPQYTDSNQTVSPSNTASVLPGHTFWASCLEKLKKKASDSSSGHRQTSSGSTVVTEQLQKKKSIDYRTFLRQFMITVEEPILDLESFDYIPYYYGITRPDPVAILEPLEYTEVNRLDELAIAIDTSGSCSGQIVKRFLEETWTILRQRENFCSKMRLHFIQCDSFIQEYRVFSSLEEWEASIHDFKILGHGNTDFCPVFDLLKGLIEKKEIRNLRGLLYFTDGDGIFPSYVPPWQTAFVFLNQETEKHQIPDWGIRLNLELPTL